MLLKVKVNPGRSKTEILRVEKGRIEIDLKAKAEKNRANESLCKFLEKILNLPPGSIKILKGRTSRNKVLNIPGEEEKILKILTEHAG